MRRTICPHAVPHASQLQELGLALQVTTTFAAASMADLLALYRLIIRSYPVVGLNNWNICAIRASVSQVFSAAGAAATRVLTSVSS